MKIMNKGKLNVTRNNDGSISIDYHINNNNDYVGIGTQELLNVKTKERFTWNDLTLLADKNDIYLYPPHLKNSRKREGMYDLFNWIFVEDTRAKRVLEEGNKKSSKVENEILYKVNELQNTVDELNEVVKAFMVMMINSNNGNNTQLQQATNTVYSFINKNVNKNPNPTVLNNTNNNQAKTSNLGSSFFGNFNK